MSTKMMRTVYKKYTPKQYEQRIKEDMASTKISFDIAPNFSDAITIMDKFTGLINQAMGVFMISNAFTSVELENFMKIRAEMVNKIKSFNSIENLPENLTHTKEVAS